MAKSVTERTRAFRERRRAQLKTAPDITREFLRRPFSEFLMERTPDFEESQDYVGIDIRGSIYKEEQQYETSEQFEEPFKGNALDRVTALAEVMMDNAREYCELINEYKLTEIDARIKEIEQADLSDPTVRKQALADVVKLNRIRARLDKEFRRSFREIDVKGTPSDR